MEKWSYAPPTQRLWATQTDWNQTLIVKFNELSRDVHEIVMVEVPNQFRELIESLEFYDESNLTIGTKYVVKFITSDNDTINVGSEELGITDFLKNS